MLMNDNTAWVTTGNYAGNIVIPKQIEYNSELYSVTVIYSSAFKGCSEVTNVDLPSSITSIESSAFESCTSLKSIVIPENVTNIGANSFYNCTSLESITVGNKLNKFGNDAFKNCNNLKKVYISDLKAWFRINFYERYMPSGQLTWSYRFTSNPLQNGADLYLNGEKIVNLVVPESITTIPEYAFIGCSSFETITIPEGVEVLKGAFSGNNNLKTLYAYGRCNASFSNCSSLETVHYKGLIGEETFSGCPNLTTVHILKKNIGSEYNTSGYLYLCFPNVKDFILHDGIQTIGQNTFKNCKTLQSINIPSSVQNIDSDAFSLCPNLKSVYIDDLEAWCNIVFGNNSSNPLSNEADLFVKGEKLVNGEIPSTITQLNRFVFYNCTSLESLTITGNVNKIGQYAFYGCKNLSHVELPDTQIEFSTDVFGRCDKLVSAGPLKSNCNIEYGWSSEIPAYAFADIHNLQKIIISSSIKTIGNYAFAKRYYGELPVTEIYSNATIPPTISSKTFSDYTATLFVPIDCKSAYSQTQNWKNFNIIELVDVESININKSQYDIIVGESKTIDVTILPEKATYKDLYWTIEDNSIASINNGVITGLKTGTTKVIATTTDGTNLSATCTISVTNPVNSVSLNKSEIQLEAGETETLTATYTPLNADDVTITWKSLNSDIAVVNNGEVKAIAVGETEIVATSVNNIEARCKIVVKPTLVTSITVNKHSLALNTGDSEILTVSILPTKATYKTVTWKSNNEQVAIVDSNGKVSAKGNGTATISVSTIDGSNLSDKCIVTVTTLATGIALNKTTANLIAGQSVSLTATISPSATSNKNIKWESNNSACASVSSDGKVNAIATGTATITATTKDGTSLSASCIITVTNPVISLTLDKTHAELMVGQQVKLSASCIPSNADNTTITWRTSDNTVASVVNGVVTANRLGNAIITASSANGIEATCSISVVPTPVSSLQLNETSISIVKDQIFALVCTVSPNDATNKDIVWYSQNEKIAKVNEKGKVTGIATGETTIIVAAKSDPNKTASCKVKVTTPITALQLDYAKRDLYVEDNLQLHAICTPSDADNKNVEWTSSNTSIAIVSNTGYVTTKNAGEVRITATTKDGTNLSASCDITVRKIKQTITWNQELQVLQTGGEMIPLQATSSSGLPITFSSSDKNILSIFDLGEVIYANPIGCGNAQITACQSGNYKYEPVEYKRSVEVLGNAEITSKTLIAYYSQSELIDGIVAELANQIAGSGSTVYTQKIEPVSTRINEANTNRKVRDSVMNVIGQYPNDVKSYPSIKSIGVNVNDYDDVIMVYPLWNSMMAAPMQTFSFTYSDALKKKSVAYIEYDLFGDAGASSNAKALRLNAYNIEDKENIIKEWLRNSEATGILQLHKDRNRTVEGIYDLQGRKVSNVGEHGLYIIKGKKIIVE